VTTRRSRRPIRKKRRVEGAVARDVMGVSSVIGESFRLRSLSSSDIRIRYAASAPGQAADSSIADVA
jgi:hypothetical protein